jgi:hypothetical protein
MSTEETPEVASLYDNLTPYREDGDTVWVVNHAMQFVFLTVAEASAGGDAGGARMTTTRPVKLWPGLGKVSASYRARVEADAARQRKRIGDGILSGILDAKEVEFVSDIGKINPAKVDGWLAMTANLEILGELRGHPKHGEAAERHWRAWHDREASKHVKTLRHFWHMAAGSKKVA